MFLSLLPPPCSSYFVLYFYYMIGTTLENEWGSFKFNLYYLFGMVGTIIAAFITGYGTSFYLNLSLFLGFAYLFPDVEVHLFLILPIKIKWLAYLNWAFFAFTILFGSMGERLAVIASLINFFIFFGKDLIDYIKFRRRYGNTRKNFKREMKRFKDTNSNSPWSLSYLQLPMESLFFLIRRVSLACNPI